MEGDKILTKERFLLGVKFKGYKFYLNTFRYNSESSSIELLVIYPNGNSNERMWIYYATVTAITDTSISFYTFIINKKHKTSLNFVDLLEKALQ